MITPSTLDSPEAIASVILQQYGRRVDVRKDIDSTKKLEILRSVSVLRDHVWLVEQSAQSAELFAQLKIGWLHYCLGKFLAREDVWNSTDKIDNKSRQWPHPNAIKPTSSLPDRAHTRPTRRSVRRLQEHSDPEVCTRMRIMQLQDLCTLRDERSH